MKNLKSSKVIIKNNKTTSHKKSGSDSNLKNNNKIKIYVNNNINNTLKSLNSNIKSNRSTKNNKTSFKLTSNIENKSIKPQKKNYIKKKD